MFEELKKELLQKAKEQDACSDQYNRAKNATTEEELLNVIYDNIEWCSSRQIVSNEYFSKFNPELFAKSGIMGNGKENTGYVNSGNWNSGDSNSGNWNSGDRNSGYRNSGNWNSGDSNSGNWNSGYRNSGDRNSGYRNSGYRNSGYRNSGNWNSGDRNSGYRNSGNWNSGDRNSGDSNSGYRNSGAFCTDLNPLIPLFNKPSKYTAKEWEATRACQLMNDIDPTVWIPWSAMSEEERKANPKLEASEGYCKTVPIKDAWRNAWGNWSDENKKEFTSLENFDAKIFEEITGIKI